MSDPENPALEPEPPRLRQLRLLVTILTATMILGLIIIMGLVVTMFLERGERAGLILPEEMALPAGHVAGAITAGDDWIGVVTTRKDGQQSFHVLDKETGALRQSIVIGE